ncbi:hypothetical protein N799_03470 [Lysobacter arseniciresistens ZS79]|uniref:Spore coat protein U/FanG domain-containing protein n=1 Tax=Lysobacter arseniciresistens ZS79 TaxID=913325 RepID=A0A0A0F2D1_9GAMM|nr:spore coat U domain-containing protein [Lysobacter arseniciresistens]KGM56488.1 hypothetical protein N799_03470 [Lysobacter arseniciresistens ZS79]
MNWLRCVIVLCLGMTGLFAAPEASAETTCWAEMTDLEFNLADPGNRTASGTIRYDCLTYGASSEQATVHMCFAIGPGSAPGSTVPARRMVNPYGESLPFQLFQDPAHTRPWGDSPAPPGYRQLSISYSTRIFGLGHGSGTVTVYGVIPDLAGIPPGDYSSFFADGRLTYQYNDGRGNNDPRSCDSGPGKTGMPDDFTFTARASVPGSCSVITASNMSFNPGGMPLSGTRTGNLLSTSTIDLTCTRRTSWQVGLDDGLHATPAGVRQMCNADGACIAYQLYKPDGASPWGNYIDVDTMEGSSAGTSQSLTVHGRVDDQPLEQAGRYSDTVKVTLTY